MILNNPTFPLSLNVTLFIGVLMLFQINHREIQFWLLLLHSSCIDIVAKWNGTVMANLYISQLLSLKSSLDLPVVFSCHLLIFSVTLVTSACLTMNV